MNCKMNHQQDRYDNCDFWFIAAYNEFISIAYADASVHRLNRSTSYREGEREHVVFYWHIKQIAAPTRLMHFVCTQFGIVCDTKAAQINWNNKRYLSYRGYTPLHLAYLLYTRDLTEITAISFVSLCSESCIPSVFRVGASTVHLSICGVLFSLYLSHIPHTYTYLMYVSLYLCVCAFALLRLSSNLKPI